MEESELDGFKKRYSHLHPLIVHRSAERARDASDLFDILENFPEKYPVVWDEKAHSWKHESDVILSEQLKEMRKKRG
jgi:hypothetical protein